MWGVVIGWFIWDMVSDILEWIRERLADKRPVGVTTIRRNGEYDHE